MVSSLSRIVMCPLLLEKKLRSAKQTAEPRPMEVNVVDVR